MQCEDREDGGRPASCASDWTAGVVVVSYWSSRPGSAVMSQVDPSRCVIIRITASGRITRRRCRTAARHCPFLPRKADPRWRLLGELKVRRFVLCFQAKWASRATLPLTAAPRRRRPPPCRGSAPTSTRRYEPVHETHR